jgi:hypothetical protein
VMGTMTSVGICWTHVSDLAAKVRDLNQKLEDIRREQQYQRKREVDFQDLSGATNSIAAWYSLAQIVVLVDMHLAVAVPEGELLCKIIHRVRCSLIHFSRIGRYSSYSELTSCH